MTGDPQVRFKKICFVRTGGSGDAGAFERALRLSERTQADLSIVSVIEQPSEGILRLLTSWSDAEAEAITGVEEESAEVERLAEVARQRGVSATGEVLRGPRFPEITRKVLQDGHDLLIKAAQPTRVIHQVLFGHTDRQLIRECPCPVWIEKPSTGASHDRIFATVDLAPFRDDLDVDPAREELNIKILQFAILLSQLEEAELHVVHVWSFDLEAPLLSRTGLADNAVAEIGKSIRQKHEQALGELVRPFLRHISRVRLLKGHAGEEIVRLAQNESADVVVMGTLCRSGIGGLLVGNTAETVLDHVDCSIVALKPPGFVSSVHL